MADENKLPNGIINPFSETFLETWQLWKDYRWEQHKFKYKGCISEQVRLMQLAKMADGHEETAKAIVLQSIGNGWTGFYKLKTIKIKANGTEKGDSDHRDATRQSVDNFYATSNRKW